jgi:S1-C subfamily serine protease
VVVRVTAGSPAGAAGLLVGDRITAIDGATVAGQEDMIARLAVAGDRVALDVDRKGRIIRVEMQSPGLPLP